MFGTSFDQENLEEIHSGDSITDTVLLVIKAVFNLMKGNIEDLDLPTKIKSGLKKLENLLSVINNNDTNKTSSKDSSRSMQMSDASQTWTICGGTGIKRPGQCAQRDKTFKIKKFVNNPNNVDIKHHGQVVRKLTV